MAMYTIQSDRIVPISQTTFAALSLGERDDLQRLLRDQIEVVAPDVLIIAEEFSQWSDSKRRIDLLGIDRDANLVVFELKRTEDGGLMDLQAIRYAAMVSAITVERAVEVFEQYRRTRGHTADEAEQAILDFLDWDELDSENFAQDVRIVLVAADFSRELTTSVLWLSERDIDIRCVRVRPYQFKGETLLDVQQVIPLPEAADYQVQVKNKKREERKSRQSNIDFTRFDVWVGGERYPQQWKRNALLIVVKHLVKNGITPEKLHETLYPIKRNRSFFDIVGEVEDVEEFSRIAEREAEKNGKRFDPRRWHLKEGDLFPKEGKTYAFTDQWGRDFHDAMKLLQECFPEIDLKWSPSTDE